MTAPSKTTLQRMAQDPAVFRQHLRIDADVGPTPFRPDPWQAADFQATDPAWRRVAGQSVEGGLNRAYMERARGHSKTGDLAMMTTWALAFSPRRLSGVAGAADRDQAQLLRHAIDRLAATNPWLRSLLDVQQWRVVNTKTGSELTILSCDAPTSYGLTPDFIAIDELTHWKSRDLWDSLISAAAKRARCLVVVISNAGLGIGESWQWKAREACRTDAAWYFSRLDGPRASWITADRLAEQRRLLPGSAYARLWLNEWQSGLGDALEEACIAAALAKGVEQQSGKESGWRYGAGLDLGLKKDRSAFVIVGQHRATGRYRLARVWTWRPTKRRKVDLGEVEAQIIDAHRAFHFEDGLCDPWQGDYLASRLKTAGVPMELHPLSGPNWDALTRHTVNQFTEGNVALYDHPLLLRGLRAMTVVEKTDGKLKLEFPDSDGGHCDEAMAFVLGMMAAKADVHPATSRPMVLSHGPLGSPSRMGASVGDLSRAFKMTIGGRL